MGAYNALDDLLPGPPQARPGLERSPHPVSGPSKRMNRPKRMGPFNALDDLLPGPGTEPEPAGAGWPGLDWGPPLSPDRPAAGRRQRPGGPGAAGDRPATRPRAAGADRAGIFDALDDLLPGPSAPPARPARVRASFSIPPEVLDAVRDAAAHLSADSGRLTPAQLAERALRAEVERLAAEHNRGRPFPPRPGR